MRIIKKIQAFLGVTILFLIVGSAIVCAGRQDPFKELKSSHFLVEYTMDDDRAFAQKVLDRAESLYSRVADEIGYSRYQQVWTWEQRVHIVLYPDQTSYSRFTGQPQWSKAYASRDSKFFNSRVIVTYSGQTDFLEEALPHEIAHLLFWDFLGFTRRVPVWFEEGLAQLTEEGKKDIVQPAMARVVSAGQAILLSELNNIDIANEDSVRVSLFYAQSLSLVYFMVEKYGQDAFRRFTRELRDGREFEEALRKAYPAIFDTSSELEKKWKNFLENSLILTGG